MAKGRPFAFGTDAWDPQHRFETSWILSPWALFFLRALFVRKILLSRLAQRHFSASRLLPPPHPIPLKASRKPAYDLQSGHSQSANTVDLGILPCRLNSVFIFSPLWSSSRSGTASMRLTGVPRRRSSSATSPRSRTGDWVSISSLLRSILSPMLGMAYLFSIGSRDLSRPSIQHCTRLSWYSHSS